MIEKDEQLVHELAVKWGQLIAYPSTDATFAKMLREAITRTRNEYEDEIAEKDAEIQRLKDMVARRDAGHEQGTRFGRVV